MRRRGVLCLQEWIVLAAVLGVHVLLIVLFALARQHEYPAGQEAQVPRWAAAASEPQRRSTLLLIDAPRRIDQRTLSAPIAPPSIDVPSPSLPDPATLTTPLQIAPPTRSPPIDWRTEAERAARSAIEGTAPPPAPNANPKQFEWNPEPQRAGFAGLLPYVRIGKRCVVGLGFFGCAIGDLPKANGQLFDAMDDPDRPRSSVPDIER